MTASGAGLSYEWYKVGDSSPVGTGSSYIVSPIAAGDAGGYYVVVSGACAPPVTSETAILTIESAAPTVTTNPENKAVCDGVTVLFTAAATGATALQWQVSTNGGSTWSNLSGATSSPLSFSAAVSENNNQYRAMFTNSCGNVPSTAAVLTVSSIPETPLNVTAMPSTITSGQSSILSATVASGETVDWYVGGCEGTLVGSGSSFTVSPLMSTTYSARARNEAADCESISCASVTVNVVTVYRKAMDFTSGNGYVSVPDDNTLDLTGQGTLEAWIYPTAFTPGAGIVFKGTPDVCYGFGFGTAESTSRNIDFVMNDASGGTVHLTAVDKELETNRWYHVACEWNRTAPYMKIYINGILKASSTAAIPAARTNDQALRVGVSASDKYYKGFIDEVRIWNSARIGDGSLNEIRDYMCRKVLLDSDLACYLQFDESEGDLCADASGNGNAGIKTNAERICSSAPIGDDSAYDYTGFFYPAFRASLAYQGLDRMTVTGDSGSWAENEDSCIHVYRVDSSPNDIIAPFGWQSFVATPRYWGVFVAGGTSPTYSMAYNYEGYPLAYDESCLKMAFRDHNCDTWENLSAALDIEANTLTKGLLSGTEFILGYNVDPRNSIQYNGSSEYVYVADPGTTSIFDLNDAGTLEAWIYPDAFTADAGILVKGTTDGINNACYGFGLSGGSTLFTGGTSANIGFVVGDSTGGVYRLTGSVNLDLGKWYHVACVWDNTAGTDTMAIYLNGVQYAFSTASIDNAATASDEDVRIGMQAISNPDVYFTGRIDEVRIWNAARSQTDIRNTMCHTIAGTESGLVGYWRFDEEITGTSCPDYTANNNSAVMYNFGTAGQVIDARTCSEAPIGSASAWSYYDGGGITPVSATLTHPDGDYMFATESGGYWFGTFSGIQIYRVGYLPVYPPDLWEDDYHTYVTPNGLTPPYDFSTTPHSWAWSSIDYSRYWGVFLTDWSTGGSEPTYDVIYNYGTFSNGNPNVPYSADKNDPTAPHIGLAKRNAYCDRNWIDSGAYWAFGTDQLELTAAQSLVQTQNGPPKTYTEYVLGGINQPLAIALASFKAKAVDGCIEISWETATEIDTLGFQLWRSEQEEGPYAPVAGSYNLSKSVMDTQGAKYAFTDCDVILDGKTAYYYKLEEIETEHQDENPFYGPIGPVRETLTASQHSSRTSWNDKACFISILAE